MVFPQLKQYGKEAIDTVIKNPYQLATDIYGIGFITADKIARQLVIAPNSPSRCRAGIVHILSVASEDGHCFNFEIRALISCNFSVNLP